MRATASSWVLQKCFTTKTCWSLNCDADQKIFNWTSVSLGPDELWITLFLREALTFPNRWMCDTSVNVKNWNYQGNYSYQGNHGSNGSLYCAWSTRNQKLFEQSSDWQEACNLTELLQTQFVSSTQSEVTFYNTHFTKYDAQISVCLSVGNVNTDLTPELWNYSR